MLNSYSHFSVEISAKLFGMLQSRDAGVRFSAVSVLWRFDKANAGRIIPVLIKELEQQVPSKNETGAIRILGEIGALAESAVPSLTLIAENTTRGEAVRAEAKKAIEKIGTETKL